MFDWLKGFGTSIADSLLGHSFRSLGQNYQFGLSSRLMREQARLNREQYDYEYQKESPAARVQQLHDAGLNTGLMYSNGLAGMQGSVGSVSAPSIGIPSSLSDISQNMLNISASREKEGLTAPSRVQMDNIKSLTSLNEANKAVAESMPDKIKAETDAVKFDTHIKRALESTTIEQAKTNLDIATESYKSLQEQVKQYKAQNEVLPEQLRNALKRQEQAIALGNVDVYLRERYGEEEAKKNLKIMDATLEEIFSKIDVNKDTCEQLSAYAKKLKTDTEYRQHVVDVLKTQGFDLSAGGSLGTIERGVAFVSKRLRELF